MQKEPTTEELAGKLNPRQLAFANKYVETGEKQKSAILAGYKEKTAHSTANKMLKKAEIKSYINRLLHEKEEAQIMTALEAMQRLSHMARGDVTTQTVVSMSDGYDMVDIPPSFAERISAIKEILKRTPQMTEFDQLKLTEMQQKQAEKEIDIAIKKRKLEILNGTSEDTMDAVSELISKIDGTFKK